MLFVCALSHRLVVVERRGWRLLAPQAPAVSGSARGLCHEEPGHPNGGDDALVLIPEVPVKQAVDDGVQTAVEIGHEVADDEEPLGNTGHHVGRIYGHRQADQVERSPADGKEHEDHEHG